MARLGQAIPNMCPWVSDAFLRRGGQEMIEYQVNAVWPV